MPFDSFRQILFHLLSRHKGNSIETRRPKTVTQIFNWYKHKFNHKPITSSCNVSKNIFMDFRVDKNTCVQIKKGKLKCEINSIAVNNLGIRP